MQLDVDRNLCTVAIGNPSFCELLISVYVSIDLESLCLCYSGKKPDYLGVQKNPPALALCPATNNCVSTSENNSDLNHYAPPW